MRRSKNGIVAGLKPMERVIGAGMLRSMKSIDKVAGSSWGVKTVRTRRV